MKVVRRHNFGKVTGWEVGWSPIGTPMMTAIFYEVCGILIDCGPSHNRLEVLEAAGKSHPKAILLTHYHEDHSGNAASLKLEFGIDVYGSRATAEKLSRPYRIFPYQMLMWGKTTPVEVRILEANFEEGHLVFEPIYTPGHSRDHLCYIVRKEGWLFSGDIYLGSQIKYFRADEKIDEQISSLKKLISLDFEALFCAHHPKPTEGKTFLKAKLQYLEDFYGRVAQLALQGMDCSSVMRRLGLKEDKLIKYLCFGNVSMKNMVRSVMKSLSKEGLSL